MKYSRAQIFDFIILSFRWFLAYSMINYGWAKLTGEQFGHRSVAILNTPLKDVGKFDLSWQLFSLDKTFNSVVGLFQIIGAVLIVINRTTLVGALILLPILGQIFLIDVAFTTGVFRAALPLRLAGMIACDLIILYYYRDRMILVWQNLTNGTRTKFKYQWWIFILMPFIGFLTAFAIDVILYPIKYLLYLLLR